MRITNKYGAPESYWRSNAVQRPYVPKRVSVTELLQPPQMWALRRRHDHELEVDCTDNIDAWFGTAVHEYLAQFADSRATAEQTVELYDVESGYTVHGTPDYTADGELIDWKTTRVRALQYDRKEWEQQTNLYALLLRANGVAISGINVWAFCRDFDPQKKGEDGYPSLALVKIPMPLWAQGEAADFLRRRLALHEAAENGMYGSCTDEDRWKRDTWAVVQKGSSRAVRGGIWGTEAQAWAFALSITETPRRADDYYEVEHRPGEPVRCKAWCVVAEKCPQWQAERPNTLAEDLEDSITMLTARA